MLQRLLPARRTLASSAHSITPHVFPQPAHHFGQWRGGVIDADVAIVQHLALAISLQQKRQQAGGIVGMDTIGVQRRVDHHAITLAHLAQQPLPTRPIDAGQAHATGRDATVQGDLFGFKHQPTGITAGHGRRSFIHPLALLLPINTAAGHKQQALGPLAMLLQPAQHMLQPFDISRAIARLVVVGGGGAVHQVVQRTDGPINGALLAEQIPCHPDDAGRQARNRTPQAMDLPTFGQ